MSDRAKDQHRKLFLDMPPRLPHLMADAMGLREVLVNLIDNAINHTAPGLGVIHVTIRHHPHEIEAIVQDNGVGIPADALPHLFTKFYRVNESSPPPVAPVWACSFASPSSKSTGATSGSSRGRRGCHLWFPYPA